jgi:crotonobetainyl-CoA:carnitine CoA-transferase CaiB-like acyl-CoA transferase
LLGEHNDEVLRGLGITDDELESLRADGVIGRVPDTAR